MIKLCKRGHPQKGGNVYMHPSGRPQCLLCLNMARSKWNADHPERERISSKRWRLLKIVQSDGKIVRQSDLGFEETKKRRFDNGSVHVYGRKTK